MEATMSSIGVFRKVEIDEETYWVYTSPDETLASSSDGGDLSFQPLFSCPRSRLKFHESNLKKDDDEYPPYTCVPHFPSTRIVDPGGKSFLDWDDDDTCKLPVVPLFWCNNEEPDYAQFYCGACEEIMLSTSYYLCLECGKMFHKECVESPLEIKHPSHPFHSLLLYNYSLYSSQNSCLYCKEEVSNFFYHCSTCDLSLHPVCAMRRVPLVIDHPKSHPHPLTFFPTQASSICNICGTIKPSPTYICIQCVFVIHEACIGFPHVIRICRHQHRISFTLSLPSHNLSCGVCRKQLDNKYGAYSCKECDAYFVHSTCALHEDVWDGKELEEVPEEEDIIDNGEPFERIADGIILHPFHSHQLRLEIINSYDITTYCHACGLPISEDQFYSCLECDFIIHECCAKAPRMIRHPLYPVPLTLSVATKELDHGVGTFWCKICQRKGNGFFYESTRGGSGRFRIDLRCASIMESFKYEGHEHPLFLPWNPGKREQCQICKYKSDESTLICLVCDYTICYGCAALPYRLRYKHDSHLLTICDGKEESDEPDWCEICEGKIKYEEIKDLWMTTNSILRRYYKCNDYCCTTLHVYCLLGIDMYMRPHNTENDHLSYQNYSRKDYSWKTKDVQILLNNSVSRPICSGCQSRCPFPIVFKGDNTVFCSWGCIGYDLE